MGSPAGNWFDQNAPSTTAAPASTGGAGGDWFAQNSPGATTTSDDQSFSGNLDKALKGEDTNLLLTSHGKATEQGVLNVVQGISQGVQGAYQGAKLLGRGLVAQYGRPEEGVQLAKDVVGGGKEAASQASQVPGAIHDINQSPDPLGMYSQVAAKTSGQAGGQALTAAATEGLRVVGAKAVKAVKNTIGVPAALSQDTAGTMATIAHNEGLPPLQSETAREAADELQQSFIKRAKDQYSVVDKAVDGDLKPVQERIQQLKKAIRAQANVNPDLADKYIDDLATQQKTLQGLIEKAKANGVPNAEQIMGAADKDYARGIAMKKVSAGIKTASGEVKMEGHPHPEKFAGQIDRMNNTGVLQRALGPDGAQAMMDTAKEGMKKFKTSQLTKKVALAGATAGVGAAGYHVVKSAIGAGNK